MRTKTTTRRAMTTTSSATTTKKRTRKGKTRTRRAGTSDLAAKAAALDAGVRSRVSALAAYGGGVDSASPATPASRVLGDRVLCVTADSPSYPDRHRDLAIG